MSSTDPSVNCAISSSTPADPTSPQTESGDASALTTEISIQQNPTESDKKDPFPSPSLTPASLLTPSQQTAISLLISGHSVSAVAAALGFHRSTVYEWKRNQAFTKELARRQHEVRHASDARLRRLLLHASHTALDSLSSKRRDRYQNAFRLLTIMRPYIPILNQPAPAFPDDESEQAQCD
jgi:hypothetical protein